MSSFGIWYHGILEPPDGSLVGVATIKENYIVSAFLYQLDGGIVKYGQEYGDDGLWEGSLHIFDDRLQQRFSDKSKDIGQCVHCTGKTSNYINCADVSCNRLVLVCQDCTPQHKLCGLRHDVVKILET